MNQLSYLKKSLLFAWQEIKTRPLSWIKLALGINLFVLVPCALIFAFGGLLIFLTKIISSFHIKLFSDLYTAWYGFIPIFFSVLAALFLWYLFFVIQAIRIQNALDAASKKSLRFFSSSIKQSFSFFVVYSLVLAIKGALVLCLQSAGIIVRLLQINMTSLFSREIALLAVCLCAAVILFMMMVRFSFAVYAVLDQKCTVKKSFIFSMYITKKCTWGVVALVFLDGLYSIQPAILMFILVFNVDSLLYAYFYNQLKQESSL